MSDFSIWIKRISISSSIAETRKLKDLFFSSDTNTAASLPYYHLICAFFELRLGKPADCVSYLDKFDIPVNDEYDFFYWTIRGMSFRQLPNGNQQALNCYFNALKIQPNRADVLFNIANIYAELDTSLSEKYYISSLQLDSSSSTTFLNLGLLYLSSSLPNKARSCFTSAYLLSPYDPEILSNLGITYVDLGYPNLAEAAFTLALSFNLDHTKSNTNLGNLLVSI